MSNKYVLILLLSFGIVGMIGFVFDENTTKFSRLYFAFGLIIISVGCCLIMEKLLK